jgi:putative salt-induced outer membrane protein
VKWLDFALPVMLAFVPAAASAEPSATLAETDTQLPEGVRAMIIAAIASGDAKTVETVIRLAKETHGQAAREIDRINEGFQTRLAETRAQQEVQRREQLAEADIFDEWKGQVEFGASRATGNTRNLGLYGALGFERTGLRWRHKVTARADIQETNGTSSSERLTAAWQPYYRFHDRFYVYGITEYEYDPFQGYDNRYTLGGGGGYSFVPGPNAKLDLEGGPAIRHTDLMESGADTTLAARASMNFSWVITPTLEFKQNSSVYYEPGDTSASALSVVDARLIGPLKARFSYDIRYESGVPIGAKSVNTQSRATLVYSF